MGIRVDRRGRLVSPLEGPGTAPAGCYPRPSLPAGIASCFVEAGETWDSRAMWLCPVWRSVELRCWLTFRGSYWTCECGGPRRGACGETALEAFCKAYYREAPLTLRTLVPRVAARLPKGTTLRVRSSR